MLSPSSNYLKAKREKGVKIKQNKTENEIKATPGAKVDSHLGRHIFALPIKDKKSDLK